MTCMRDIRKTSDRTDNCFEPLRDTVSPNLQYLPPQSCSMCCMLMSLPRLTQGGS